MNVYSPRTARYLNPTNWYHATHPCCSHCSHRHCAAPLFVGFPGRWRKDFELLPRRESKLRVLCSCSPCTSARIVVTFTPCIDDIVIAGIGISRPWTDIGYRFIQSGYQHWLVLHYYQRWWIFMQEESCMLYTGRSCESNVICYMIVWLTVGHHSRRSWSMAP